MTRIEICFVKVFTLQQDVTMNRSMTCFMTSGSLSQFSVKLLERFIQLRRSSFDHVPWQINTRSPLQGLVYVKRVISVNREVL